MLAETSQEFAVKLGAMWCSYMHNSPMWPAHGQYQCRTCGRYYPVPWESAETPKMQHTPVPSLRRAVLPLIALLAILAPANARAAEGPVMESNSGAAMAFARYISGASRPAAWNVEAIDIDASLPKSRKQGRLRAIRRLLPLGKPEFQVLELEGDQTVRQQVILRYLSAQVLAAAIPENSIAITPVNYKFTYLGAVETKDGAVYSFAIKPRKKREGLIRGELWLDGRTGSVVRQSGYLVKNPSMFVKRINVIQETAIHDGLAGERATHLSVDTRLIGRAELIIHERPYTDPAVGSTPGIQER